MKHILLLVPTGVGVGLTAVSTGLVRALESQGLRVNYFKPVTRDPKNHDAIPMQNVEHLLGANRLDDLLETIVANFEKCTQDADIIVVQGLVTTQTHTFSTQLNAEIAKTLDAEVIFVTTPGRKSVESIAEEIEIAARIYGSIKQKKLLGYIINKIGAPTDEQGHTRLDLLRSLEQNHATKEKAIPSPLKPFPDKQFPLIGAIPWKTTLFSPRVVDILDVLHADIINKGNLNEHRISHITICARTVPNMLDVLQANTLVITAGDRIDIIIATCMAALKGIKIAALVLTGGYAIDDNVMAFCAQAIEQSGLPILTVKTNSFHTALLLQNLNMKIPQEDVERIEAAKQTVADHIDKAWISKLISRDYQRQLSPAAFRYQLVEKAKKAQKRIVLPEGNEPRTLAAAAFCSQKNIAECILLGDEKDIRQVAENNNVALPDNIKIINPDHARERYIAPMVKLREHKGMTDLIAESQLQDNVVLGTMMLQCGDVDGLVSGALHTTANTIRPALQLIKTAKTAKLVSSLFFMCLPEQVLVFADCAVNPDPSAEELADIAIQSADSATAFGIPARVAMISYSTGESGSGSSVEKVRQATQYVKEKRPDILVDGPLQYDAAIIEHVAKSKAPNSPVAGQATVCIFPNLNTGNTTYKAVQRSANVLCIGPMLQGLAKPVNDLSRGASIDDIIYTIAITAIQAKDYTHHHSRCDILA